MLKEAVVADFEIFENSSINTEGIYGVPETA
jgi:hypothetical protein